MLLSFDPSLCMVHVLRCDAHRCETVADSFGGSDGRGDDVGSALTLR